MKLQKGDTVEVITGKDKGKQGEIAFVFPKTNKIIVNGVNIASKHSEGRAVPTSRAASSTRTCPSTPAT